MAKDKIGNVITIGDLMSAMIKSQRGEVEKAEIFGHVVAVTDGGIATVGGKKGPGPKNQLVTPGVVKMRFEMDFYFDPEQGVCSDLLKLVNPADKPKILQ